MRRAGLAILWLAPAGAALGAASAAEEERPNVVLILADDLGYGDLSLHGNPVLRTPHLDRMAERGVRVDPFYVSPFCALSRAALFTGAWPRRVGVVVNEDPLPTEALTLAERLRAAGYATGIFGKWHLGEHHPHRPQDQGFETTLVSRGGVLGRLADQPVLGRYTDPWLEEDGTVRRFEGYATRVVFDACLAWIDRCREARRPFLACVPTHAPHAPFEDVPIEALERLRARLAATDAEGLAGDRDELARMYAMIEDLDANVGRFLAALEERGLAERTLVLFLSDNGAAGDRWSAGLRGGKGSVREGGVRAPCFALWPGTLEPGRVVDRVLAHVDVLPTILEACGVAPGPGTPLDGRSFWPLLRGESPAWPERPLFLGARRSERNGPFWNFAVRGVRHKLVRSHSGKDEPEAHTVAPLDGAELYDLVADPLETRDVLAQERELALVLWERYAEHVRRLEAEGLARTRVGPVLVGSPAEDPVLLTRANWKRIDRLMREGGGSKGFVPRQWSLRVEEPGAFEVRVRFVPAGTEGAGDAERLLLRFDAERRGKGVVRRARIEARAASHDFARVRLERGEYALTGTLVSRDGNERPVWQVELRRLAEGDPPVSDG